MIRESILIQYGLDHVIHNNIVISFVVNLKIQYLQLLLWYYLYTFLLFLFLP